jgi:hypothetical protein
MDAVISRKNIWTNNNSNLASQILCLHILKAQREIAKQKPIYSGTENGNWYQRQPNQNVMDGML